MILKYFNKPQYATLEEALKAIKLELTALWDRDVGVIADTSGGEPSTYIPDIGSSATQPGMFQIGIVATEGSTCVSVTYGMQVYAGVAKVNGKRFVIDKWTSDPIDGTAVDSAVYVRIKYTPEGGVDTGAGTPRSQASAVIELCNSIEDDSADNAYYYIGCVHCTDAGYTTEQWHVGGEAALYYGIPCDVLMGEDCYVI